MENDTKETASITIVYGKVSKLLRKTKLPTSDAIDQKLLGEDFCKVLYGNVSSPASKNKIRNYINNGTGTVHNQAVHSAERIYDFYFAREFSEDLVTVRARIYETWKNKFQSNCPDDYRASVTDFLRDSAWNSDFPSVNELKSFLGRFCYSQAPEDRAEFMTVLTLLSVTRGWWDKIDPQKILPANYAVLKQSEEEKDFENAQKLLYKEKKYAEAANKLESLLPKPTTIWKEKRKTSSLPKGELFYHLVQAYRGIQNGLSKMDSEYQKYTKEIDHALRQSAKEKYIPAMLETAKHFFSQGETAECKASCHRLIEADSEARECGEAYWLLYSLEEPDSEEANLYLCKSSSYSYPAAVKKWNENNPVSLTRVIKRTETVSSSGLYYVNAENIYSQMIEKTAPETWKKQDFSGQKEDAISSDQSQKYFLISDDFHQNLKDLLCLLQAVKELPMEESNGTTVSNMPFEFFIRGHEEEISPLVDTALTRIANHLIPVHILDDAKRSARILAQHPLFYSVRNLEPQSSAYLNFVVVGDTDCCEWLIREAFWMLTFRNSKITTAISVLAPKAKEMVERLKFHCPNITQKGFPTITPISCDYESSNFMEEINRILGNGFTYCAIDTASDIQNMALAIKMREITIRKTLQDSKENFEPEFPIIVFRCQDPDIANLSRHSTVINEDFGFDWFNHYGIIPFGGIDQQYHWSSLTDNLLEKLGLNVHLQYYFDTDFDISSESEEDKKQYREALRTFYQRTYNRDSSIAVAMSLPYRLYQGIKDGKHILPIRSDSSNSKINILNSDMFFSAESRKIYIDSVESAGWETAPDTDLDNPRSEFYQLSEWEHNRWNRFMISRGWKPATLPQMRSYHKKGNKRQQLYIAKMHPCIREFEQLTSVDKTWKELSGKDSSFQKNDSSSIQNTRDILKMKWTRPQKQWTRDD